MFHKSAFFALVLYFAAHYIKIRTSRIAIILAMLTMLSGQFQRLVAIYLPRYSVYFSQSHIQEGTRALIVFGLIGVVALLFRKRIVTKDPVASLYFNIYFVGLAIYIVFADMGTLGHRFSLYGTIYSILLVPKIVALFKPGISQTTLRYVIYAFCVIMFFYTVYIGSATYLPYKTILNIN